MIDILGKAADPTSTLCSWNSTRYPMRLAGHAPQIFAWSYSRSLIGMRH
jgi:hypothetical protein